MRIIATIMLLMALASEYEPLGVKLHEHRRASLERPPNFACGALQ